MLIVNEDTSKILKNTNYISFYPDDSDISIKDKIFILDNSILLSETIILCKISDTFNYKTIGSYISFDKLLSNIGDYTDFRTKLFLEQFEDLKHKFPELKKRTLEIINKSILFSTLPELFEDYRNSIDEFVNETNKVRYNLYKIYKTILPDISSYQNNFIDTLNGEFPYTIKGILYDIRILKEPHKWDFQKIIKEYKVNNTVPLLFTYKEYDAKKKEKPEPIIKYIESIKDKLKEWLLKNGDVVKKSRGLSFRILANDNDIFYLNCNIAKNSPKIVVRGNLENHNVHSFKHLYKLPNNISDFISKISKINSSMNISLINTVISNTTVEVLFKKNIPLSLINKCILTQYRNILNLGIMKNSSIKVILIKDPTIKMSFHDVIIESPRDTHGKISIISKTNVIFSGIKKEQQLIQLIPFVIELLHKAYNLKISGSPKQIIKSYAKLKDLKNAGIKVDARGCEKKRQPFVIKKISSQKSKGSSQITYKGTTFECKNPDYLFPGFTVTDTLCCFKKDQTNKITYIRNSDKIRGKSISKIILNDKQILQQKIIITDKLLDNNRIGIIPDIIKSYLNSSFYRLGVHNNSFINCVKDTKQTLFNFFEITSKITVSLFKALEDGDILPKFKNMKEYIQYILKDPLKLDPFYIKDLLSRYIKMNIVIIKISKDSGNVVCFGSNIHNLQFEHSIVILNNRGHYELLIKINSGKIQRIFNNEEIKSLLSLEDSSCKINLYINGTNQYSDILTMYSLPKNIKIKSQYINPFNKVTYVLTNYGILPVASSGSTYKLPEFDINNSSVYLAADKQMNLLSKLSVKYLEPKSVIKSDKHWGILTNSNLIIPVKKVLNTVDLNNISGISVVPNIDNIIYNGTGTDSSIEYNKRIIYYKELYEMIRLLVSKKINKKSPQNLSRSQSISFYTPIVSNILTDPKYVITGNKNYQFDGQLSEKRGLCNDINSIFCIKNKLYIKKDDIPIYIKKIVNEIISGNNKEILNDKVPVNYFTDQNFIKRQGEMIVKKV